MIKEPFIKRLRLAELIPIFILSAIPLLWYNPPGLLIGGVDFDAPLEPIRRFIERKFTWSTLYLAGNDRSMDIPGGFAFIGVQAFFKLLGFNLLNVQKLSFIFWFALTGISMYILMSLLVKGDTVKDKIIRVSATIFYMINFYQLHIWMIARIGELSGAILIPVSLGLLIKSLEGEVPLSKCFMILAIFFLFGSGIGVQPPVLGVFFIAIAAYFIYHLLLSLTGVIKERRIFSNIVFFIAFLIFFFLINAFWILPIANFTVQSNYASGSFENMDAIFNLRGLLEATSGRTNSFLNVMRLYGDNIWFDGYKNVPYLPFFTRYLTNPFLIILSFLFPILAYAAVIVRERNYRYTIFFTLLALGATFISKGIHEPLGDLFLWAFKNIPGFWVYRAPWQKFGLLMMVSYAFLAGITIGYIYEFLKSRISKLFLKTFVRFLLVTAIVLIFGIYLIYNYGFIFGRMLPTTEERQVLPGFHQDYPAYLFEAAKWINNQSTQFNILILPDDKANAYDWGYGGAEDITVKLFNKGIVFRQYGEGMAPPRSLDNLYHFFQTCLYKDYSPRLDNLLKILNVRYLLQRNDFTYNWSGDNDSPQFIQERLKFQKDISLDRSFGKWDFYKVDKILPNIYASRGPAVSDEEKKKTALNIFLDGKPRYDSEKKTERKKISGNPQSISFYNTRWYDFTEVVGEENKELWEFINKPETEGESILAVDGSFYLPRAGDYILKAMVTPHFSFVRKKKMGPELKLGVEEELKNWTMRPLRVTYDYSTDEDGIFVLSVYFDGDSKEDEFVNIQTRKFKVDLKEFPYFDLVYRVEDPGIQTMEVVAGIDLDADGNIDGYIRGICPDRASQSWAHFTYDLYTKAKRNFPDQRHYELLHLELNPHKLWRTDCTSKDRKKEYKFWIKGFKFYNYYPEEYLEFFQEALNIDFRVEEEIEKWTTKEIYKGHVLKTYGEEFAKVKPWAYLELSRSIDKINLKEFPMLELRYKDKEHSKDSVELMLDLDFDGDNKVDKNILFNYLTFPEYEDRLTLNIYELAKDIYPAGKEFNLIQVKLRSDDRSPFPFKQLRVYSHSLVAPGDFVFHKPVFRIDGKKYYLEKKIKDKEDAKENMWLKENIHLDKGEHKFTWIDDDEFTVDWVMMETPGKTNYQPSDNYRGPQVQFRKVNPTKYIINIEEKEPFWLIFSETFHNQWKAYLQSTDDTRLSARQARQKAWRAGRTETEEIVAEYPKYGVKEIKPSMKFTPGDIKFLFTEDINEGRHFLINGYANGWYIDPKVMGLPEDFTLVLYFLPQSFFYAGMFISILTFLICVFGYIFYVTRLKKGK